MAKLLCVYGAVARTAAGTRREFQYRIPAQRTRETEQAVAERTAKTMLRVGETLAQVRFQRELEW